MSGIVFVNGALHPIDAAVLRADDRGFLFGDGVFETMRARDGRIVGIARHQRRLQRSLEALEIEVGPADALNDIAISVLIANALQGGESYVRVSVSRGPGAGPRPPRAKQTALPTVIATARPIAARTQDARKGVAGRCVRGLCRAWAAHKHLGYLPSVLAHARCREIGDAVAEPLLVDDHGRVVEGATSNVFARVGRRIATPPDDGRLLPGIARAIFMEATRRLGYDIVEAAITPTDLALADEAWITNAVLRAAPLDRIDDRRRPLSRGPSAMTAVIEIFDQIADAP